MLTTQEKRALISSIDSALETVNRMKSVITKISEKRYAVEQIIITQNSIEVTAASKQIDELINLTAKLDKFLEKIVPIKTIDENIPDVFKTFIQKEFVLFDWKDLYLTNLYTANSLNALLDKQKANEMTISDQDSSVVGLLCALPQQYTEHVSSLEQKIATYEIFDKIKWISNNIVMIGANGSGKSTFSRQLSGKISSNISILSAQHLLVYRQQKDIPASNGEIASLRAFQKNSKMSSDSNFASLIGDDMNKLITALIAEHTDKALGYYAGETRQGSFLETTIDIWHELIEHRKLVLGRGSISAQAPDKPAYSFNSLSDGEKAVFYYVGHILLVEPNSYIIVDEPENHLHMAICSKLWDKLEQIRPDCKFIYLTHNLDFAASRTNTTLIWNKNFSPPNIWDFEIIESDETLPDTLLMEVLGSRKRICFCEGKDKSCLDYKLYSILFPEYTVIPVGGHLDVISYTNAYNKSTICANNAIGIIDGDCHKPEQISKWQEQSIFTIPINEIENILCDPSIIETAITAFMSGEEASQRYYDMFWQELERDKVQQTVWYVNNIINNKFKENFLHEKQNIGSLKTELLTIKSAEEIDALYEERLQAIETFIQHKNYEGVLTIVNFKGKLTKYIAKNTIVDNYPDRILGLIKSNCTLKDSIKQKYFATIPQ